MLVLAQVSVSFPLLSIASPFPPLLVLPGQLGLWLAKSSLATAHLSGDHGWLKGHNSTVKDAVTTERLGTTVRCEKPVLRRKGRGVMQSGNHGFQVLFTVHF